MKKFIGIAMASVLAVACQPRDRPATGEMEEREPGQMEQAQRFTEVGRVTNVGADSITLERATGEELDLEVRDTTSVTMEGRPVQIDALPEGSQVRASYMMVDDDRIADSIEVIQVQREDQQQRQQQPGAGEDRGMEEDRGMGEDRQDGWN